ncbi:hypothetical protein QCB45_09745 [Thiomicrorhabdus sp. ZW0627]|uniref:hypothetical protein n=1 Tax=Thiomicrorhabdus sp. ZW0627 TaxID=3039774 RepID=UPI0024367C71|nr:hypothetical protein [Thiomicrorhabdus sp. ZW0627]MDG6774616.1 hypothetical protein [Thiomicrorhabdus sp. ZW0627]
MKFSAYKVNHVHRGGLPIHQKSQWTVPEWDELRLFLMGYDRNWVDGKNNIWNVAQNMGAIGRDTAGDLSVAKYVCNQNEWHGYTVSPKRNGDKPPSEVVKTWVAEGIIKKKDGTNIMQGKV